MAIGVPYDIFWHLTPKKLESFYKAHQMKMRIGQVVWDEETISFQVTERLSCESYEALDGECEVISNIFDNPELLEEATEG